MALTSSSSITNLSQQAQKGLIAYLWHCKARYQSFYAIRGSLEDADRAYYREQDYTQEHVRARLANTGGDASKFQDVTVPVVMPQVEAFVAYMSSVFLSGNPIFGVVASPEYEDEAIQIEAIVDKQSIKGRWRAELIKYFRDCGKYGYAAAEVPWDKITTPTFETDLAFSTSEARPKNIVWEGNVIKRLDMYNTFWDTQVHPSDLPRFGEYAGYNELVTRMHLKQDVAALGSDVIVANVVKAFESGTPLTEYYIPQLNPKALAQLSNLSWGNDWFAWAGLANGRTDIAYKSAYVKTTIYIRLLPSEFDIKVPQPNTPQVWKFIIVNFSVIIYAERQTNAHEMIPIIIACPNDDGIKYQTKSLAQNVMPMQQVGSAMMNAMMAATRRSVSDRGIYNPLYIESKDINSSNPAAKISCKPTAYAGVGLNEMYYSIPFHNDQFPTYMQSVSTMMGFADVISGRNKAQQGQFVKGNKTLHEYDSVMGNANARAQLDAIVLEDQFFSPAKTIIMCNILQYQTSDEIYHEERKQTVKIDPLAMRNAIWKFKISDGLLPSDKLINADAWQVAMQVIGSSPAIGPAYNIAPMFSYLMKTQGADISDFEKSPQQQQFEQATAAWQQALIGMAKSNPEISAKQLPPQPTPQQFGLGPDGKPLPVADNTGQPLAKLGEKSIYEQVMELGNPAVESQEPASEQQVEGEA
jgi:hypothetical protein